MKRLFKIMKAFDYLTVLLIFGLVVVQTYFEMELISYVKDMLSLVGVSKEPKDFWAVGWKPEQSPNHILLWDITNIVCVTCRSQ